METTRGEPILGSIRLLFEVGTVAGMSDGQLLDRFLDRRRDEEAAEVAFAALVERHGPMVLRACRSRLGDEHDAQDAFQATFLILARKAGAIRKHESAASWLHGVARRVASCARRAAAVRRAKEHKAAAGKKADFVDEGDRSDLVPAVREEVGDLPEKYRTPLMLCLLDGLTHEEAATRLGWPVGTVKTRVRRAKDRLRVALTRRGLAPSLGAIGAALAAREASAMPASLVRSTARAALSFEVGRSTALLSASVARLVELGMGSLIMTRLKIIGLVVASIGVLAVGTTRGLARQDSKDQEKPKPVEARPVEKAMDLMVSPSPEIAKEPVLVRAAEDVKQDAIAQLEMARLHLEISRKNVEMCKDNTIQAMKSVDNVELRLKNIRSTNDLDELGKYEAIPKNGDFAAAKKHIEDFVGEYLVTVKGVLKRSLVEYSDLKRELAREEERVKELEARAGRVAPAATPPAGMKPAEGDGPGVDDRLDGLKLLNIGVELSRMEIERSKERLKAAHRYMLDIRNRAERFRRPEGMTDDDYRRERDRLDEEKAYASADIREAERLFENASHQLVERERGLRDLAKNLPETIRAEFFRSTADPKRPLEVQTDADVSRRLSDVERKLDLILKALEKQGREPGKE